LEAGREDKEGAMTKAAGGSRVNGGFYWKTRTWEIVTIGDEGGVLEGGPGEAYLRVPTLVLLGLAPLLGGAFVVFLPLVGFVLVLRELGRKTMGSRRRPVTPVAPRGAEEASVPVEHPRAA
jgi:hypothetical protein